MLLNVYLATSNGGFGDSASYIILSLLSINKHVCFCFVPSQLGGSIQQCNAILILSSTEPIIIQVGFVIFCYSYLPITISSPVDLTQSMQRTVELLQVNQQSPSSVAYSPLGLIFATNSFSNNAAIHTLPKYCVWADHLSLHLYGFFTSSI